MKMDIVNTEIRQELWSCCLFCLPGYFFRLINLPTFEYCFWYYKGL